MVPIGPAAKSRKPRAGPLARSEAMGVGIGGAGLAQLVEHLICNQGARGSNPPAGTILFKDLVTIITLWRVRVESHVIAT